MIRFERYRAGHMHYLVPQAQQKMEYGAAIDTGAFVHLENTFGLSAWAGGRCVGAAGLIPAGAHKARAWMFLSTHSRRYMVPLVRRVKHVVEVAPWDRIELTVDAGFPEGIRFAELIGAKCETPEPLRKYGIFGRDEYMFAIVR